MMEVVNLVLMNMEKVGIGAVLFLSAYISNMGLGAWKNIKIEGDIFDWSLIVSSIFKFVVLIVSIALLSIVVSIIPVYATYVGITIEAETLSAIDSLVIIGSFLYATIKYIKDAIDKLKTILGN